MSFANLKKRSGAQVEKLVAAAEAAGGGNKYAPDETIWKPTVDKAGNGYAVVRFLPAKDEEDLPWIRYWDHGFQGPNGQWYIEKSLTTLGQDDPVSEMNSALWNSGHEEDKDTARKRKRRLHYVSNIYVVTDQAAPENEGKVFKFIYGKKIFDKIMDVMQPQFDDEEAIDPFDFWEGAEFKLKIRQVEGYRNYDKSEFTGKKPLLDGDDAKLEEVYKQLHDLKELVDPKNFKTYAELKAKLNRVLGIGAGEQVDSATAGKYAPVNDNNNETATPAEPKEDSESEEDTMAYFRKLANE